VRLVSHVQLNCTELLSTIFVTKISVLIFDKGIYS